MIKDDRATGSQTLHLTLKKKWFDMILSGEKKEEYREYKDYWKKRFLVPGSHPAVFKPKPDVICFTNGCGKDKPSFTIECKGLSMGFGLAKWGGETGDLLFKIELGVILETRNIK